MKTPRADISDAAIVQTLQDDKNFERGFRLLMDKYQERLYWHIRRMVHEHDDANDVLQNCLLKVYRNIGSFKGNSKLYTWLYRIATNESLTFLQKKKRKSTGSLDAETNGLAKQMSADTFFDADAAQQILKAAIHQLPAKQQLVFNMRYYDELSYQEMSDVLETSIGALKASYHHAVKKIEHFVRREGLN